MEAVEYFDVLDEEGNKTGETKLRAEVHRDGDWHRAVLVGIINDKGEFLLQRRSMLKKWAPGLLDISVGGHLVAGDTVEDGAIREVKEEIGLDIRREDLEYMMEYKNVDAFSDGQMDRCFFTIYLVRTNKTLADMKMEEDEVTELRFVPFREFKEMVARREPDLVPHPEAYGKLIEVMEEEFGGGVGSDK